MLEELEGIKKYIVLAALIIVGLFLMCIFFVKGYSDENKVLSYKEAKQESIKIETNRRQYEEIKKKIREEQQNNSSIKYEKTTVEEKVEEKKNEEKKSEVYKEYENLSDEEKDEIEAKPRENEVPMEELEKIKEDQEKEIDKEIEIPDKFNLKDVINLKTENQGGRGLCWAFASLNSLETHLELKNGKDYDFSEQHLNYLESNLLKGNRVIDDGGSFDSFVNYAIKYGVVNEETVPYEKDYGEAEYKEFSKMKHVVDVTDYISFPGVYWGVEDFDEKTLELREPMKKHIITNGSLYVSIDAYRINGNRLFVSKDNPSMPNHAVSVVGWDDNYSKDNFNYEGFTPKEDGAWIAFNSWGDAHYDAESKTYTPFFYISYEDANVYTNVNGVTSVEFDSDHALDVNAIKDSFFGEYLYYKYKTVLIDKDDKSYFRKIIAKGSYHIDFVGEGELDIKDILFFKDIYSLSIRGYKIKNVDKLSEFKNLNSLTLEDNNISEIDELSTLDKLESLYIINNPKISGYGKISSLKFLIIKDSKLEEIEDLSNTDILYLVLSNNNISSIKNLPKNLNEIDLSNNKISDLSLSVLNLSKLVNVTLDNNELTSLDGLTNHSLCVLSLNNNKLENIMINNNSCTRTYYDDNGNPSNIDYGLTLSAKNNNFSEYPSIINSKINILDLEKNNISSLENANFANTIGVILNDNKITSLDNVDFKDLMGILLANNKITNIDNVDFKNITDLSLENNGITSLEGFDFNNISYLDLSGNGISSLEDLDLKQKQIRLLNLSKNNLIDVSDLSKYEIDRLLLDNNKGVKGFEKLNVSYLSLNNCDLTKIDELSDNVNGISLDGNKIDDFSIFNRDIPFEDVSLNNINIQGNLDLKATYLSFNGSKIKEGKIRNKSDYFRIIVDDISITGEDIEADNLMIFYNINKITEDELLKLYEKNNYFGIDDLEEPLEISLQVTNGVIDLDDTLMEDMFKYDIFPYLGKGIYYDNFDNKIYIEDAIDKIEIDNTFLSDYRCSVNIKKLILKIVN